MNLRKFSWLLIKQLQKYKKMAVIVTLTINSFKFVILPIFCTTFVPQLCINIHNE